MSDSGRGLFGFDWVAPSVSGFIIDLTRKKWINFSEKKRNKKGERSLFREKRRKRK